MDRRRDLQVDHVHLAAPTPCHAPPADPVGDDPLLSRLPRWIKASIGLAHVHDDAQAGPGQQIPTMAAAPPPAGPFADGGGNDAACSPQEGVAFPDPLAHCPSVGRTTTLAAVAEADEEGEPYLHELSGRQALSTYSTPWQQQPHSWMDAAAPDRGVAELPLALSGAADGSEWQGWWPPDHDQRGHGQHQQQHQQDGKEWRQAQGQEQREHEADEAATLVDGDAQGANAMRASLTAWEASVVSAQCSALAAFGRSRTQLGDDEDTAGSRGSNGDGGGRGSPSGEASAPNCVAADGGASQLGYRSMPSAPPAVRVPDPDPWPGPGPCPGPLPTAPSPHPPSTHLLGPHDLHAPSRPLRIDLREIEHDAWLHSNGQLQQQHWCLVSRDGVITEPGAGPGSSPAAPKLWTSEYVAAGDVPPACPPPVRLNHSTMLRLHSAHGADQHGQHAPDKVRRNVTPLMLERLSQQGADGWAAHQHHQCTPGGGSRPASPAAAAEAVRAWAGEADAFRPVDGKPARVDGAFMASRAPQQAAAAAGPAPLPAAPSRSGRHEGALPTTPCGGMGAHGVLRMDVPGSPGSPGHHHHHHRPGHLHTHHARAAHGTGAGSAIGSPNARASSSPGPLLPSEALASGRLRALHLHKQAEGGGGADAAPASPMGGAWAYGRPSTLTAFMQQAPAGAGSSSGGAAHSPAPRSPSRTEAHTPVVAPQRTTPTIAHGVVRLSRDDVGACLRATHATAGGPPGAGAHCRGRAAKPPAACSSTSNSHEGQRHQARTARAGGATATSMSLEY